MKIDKNTMKAFGVISLAAFAMTVIPEISLAGAPPNNNEGLNLNNADADGPWEEAGCAIVGWFTGATGKVIATMAVIFLGIAAFFGKVTWGLALMFAVGIFAIFGAGDIIEAVSSAEDGRGCVGDAVVAPNAGL